MSDLSFFEELNKRRVFQVAAIYVAVAWGVTEILVTVVDTLFLPEWVSSLAVILFIVGFPIAMFLAWTFDITPDGVQRTTIDSRRGKASLFGAVALLLASTAALFVFLNPAERSRDALSSQPDSIAVLPFINESEIGDDDFIIEGIGDDLRDQLGKISGLQMAARSSSIVARRETDDPIAVASNLGVELLVEGSVARRGDRLKVFVELVDGSSGLSVWNDSFIRSHSEIYSLQQVIIDRIIAEVSPDANVTSLALTRSASATEALLLARHYEHQVRENVAVDDSLLAKALEKYEEATVLDPSSALAFSHLASARMYAGDFAGAEAPIFRAVTLDPEISEVQNTLGNFYLATGVKGAGKAFQRATELNRNNSDALANYAWWLWMQGNAEAAEPLYLRALELDRLSLNRFGALADFYGYSGNTEKALEIAARIEENFDSAASYRVIGRIMELVGRIDVSIAWTLRARDAEPGNPDHRAALAELYAEIGDFVTAEALSEEENIGLLFKMRRYQELIDVGEFLLIDRPEDLELQMLLSFAYTATGKPELAIRLLSVGGSADRALGEARHPTDIESLVYLMEALEAGGELDLAMQLAKRWTEREHVENDHWWVNIYVGCPYAILGEDEQALLHLKKVGQSARLPWDALIRDMPCFKRYSENPTYQRMLKSVDERRAQLLERLPETLREHDVRL